MALCRLVNIAEVKSCFYLEIQQGSCWTQFSGNYQNSIFVMGMILDLPDTASRGKCLKHWDL